MSPEARMKKRLLDRSKGLWLVDSVESYSTATGIPDLAWAAFNVFGWTELKSIKTLSPVVKVPVRPAQRGWLTTRWKRVQRCWVLVEVQDEETLYLFQGKDADALVRVDRARFQDLKIWHCKWSELSPAYLIWTMAGKPHAHKE